MSVVVNTADEERASLLRTRQKHGPLSTTQTAAVSRLQKYNEKKPSSSSTAAHRSELELTASSTLTNTPPSTSLKDSTIKQSDNMASENAQKKPFTTTIIPKEHIQTLPEFWNWWSPLEAEIAASQAGIYVEHNQDLTSRLAGCDAILTRLEGALNHLNYISSRHTIVQGITSSLSDLTLAATSEQEHLSNVLTSLVNSMTIYSRLDGIMRFLSASGTSSVVLDPAFPGILTVIDEALIYLDSDGKEHKEALTFRGKFRHCLTRGLMLVKIHFVSQIRAIGRQLEVAKRVEVNRLFKQISSKMKPLVALIASRFPSHVEYYSLYQDCLSAFFHVRFALVKPALIQALDTLATEEKSLLSYCRSGLAWFQQTMLEEEELYFEFFDNSGIDSLQAHLNNLSSILYSSVRPRVLQESDLTLLSDLCQCFLLHLRDPSATTASASISNDNPSNSVASKVAPLRLSSSWIGSLLSDTQDRLCFKAQAYVRSEIGGFRPVQIDLLSRGKGLPEPMELTSSAQPIHLEGSALNKSASAPVNIGDSSISTETPAPMSSGVDNLSHGQQRQGTSALAVGKQIFGGGEWYPAVSRTVRIMSLLHPAVPEAVFEDLSQESIGLCLASLKTTGEQLSARPGNIKMDGQLFTIKNLLMLREQISPFDTRFIKRQEALDFSDMIKRISAAVRNSGLGVYGNNIARSTTNLLSMVIPKVVESRADMKLVVDMELKSACEDIILDCSKSVLEPITSFLLKVQAFLRTIRSASGAGGGQVNANNMSSGSGNNLMQHAFSATLPNVQAQFNSLLESKLTFCADKMRNYLGDKSTERILFRVIHNNIVMSYANFYQLVLAEYPPEISRTVKPIQEVSCEIERIVGITGLDSDLFNGSRRASSDTQR